MVCLFSCSSSSLDEDDDEDDEEEDEKSGFALDGFDGDFFGD